MDTGTGGPTLLRPDQAHPKDPSDRPQTARELARRLEAVPVSDEWTPELARAWWATYQPAAIE